MGNKEIFNNIAMRYNTSERIEVAKISANAIKRHIENGTEKNAIDFGCGTGIVGLELINEFKSILFVDSAENMVEFVKNELEMNGIKNADATCIDLETEQRLDLDTDYIIAVQVLLHINDVEDILSKLYELLNKDGHLVIVDYDKNDSVLSELVHNGFEQKSLEQKLKQIGFKDVYCETFYHGKNIFMNKDASLFIIDAKK